MLLEDVTGAHIFQVMGDYIGEQIIGKTAAELK